ncbi:MAG TPA: ATP-binding protein, partial [Acidobacteriota bacterium]|nr:ATP-binding protein [Acidobacteriota bacterium]
MAPESESVSGDFCPGSVSPAAVQAAREGGDARLLLDAFEMFTQASSSLESAFQQLKARAQRLSDELAAKNRELKKSLREKEEVQNYLKTILECLPCGVLVLDGEGRLSLCNPVASQLLNLPGTRPGGSRKKAPAFRETQLSEYFESPVGAEASERESEISFQVNGRVRIIAASGTALKDASGHSIGTLHIIRDVTEIRALEEQNKRGERLSAMGEMAVELAHEIRNPLGSIELFASLLEKELPDGSDPKRWAGNIRIGSRSLNNIVSNMLHFANPLAPTLRVVDAHAVVHEVLGFTDLIMNQRGVCVRKELSASHPEIRADKELLKQVILNLILNAMQAMPSQGSLTICSRNVNEYRGALPGVGLELTIQDTGVGIPPENLARIFDPFFTTNKNGTGLGLSVVHQIVDRHSGYIQVESAVNVGTTFTLVFPCALM